MPLDIISALVLVGALVAALWRSLMASNDNQAGTTILPGGVDILVPDLLVARAVGTVVMLSTDGTLHRSTNATSATYVAMTTASGAAWPGQVEIEGLTVDTPPTNGETYTLTVGTSTVVYTFATTPAVSTDVLIGTIAVTQAALETAIKANQGGSGGVVTAIDYGSTDPLYLVATTPGDSITQTDGTGGDLTILAGGQAIGQATIAAATVAPFHIRYTVSSTNVTLGYVIFALPVGWEFVDDSHTLLVFNGASKGAGEYSSAPLLCTANLSLPGQEIATGLWYIQLNNAGVTPFTQNDQISFWGLMELS